MKKIENSYATSLVLDREVFISLKNKGFNVSRIIRRYLKILDEKGEIFLDIKE